MSTKLSWQRPHGPLNVWTIVDGYETLNDGTKKAVKFSIQDIPDEDVRRKEVLDLLRIYFLENEPLTKCLNIKYTDPDGVQDFVSIWQYGLDQGVVIGCYKLDTDGNITELVGCNSLFMVTKETAEDMKTIKNNFKSPNTLKIFKIFEDLAAKGDVCKRYNVDKYISSISLVVLPSYRGQRLGFHILNARSDMARKYGFPATSTMFTATASQIQAKRAGFEEGSSIDYENAVDSEGNLLFPNIESKCAKIMMKRLP